MAVANSDAHIDKSTDFEIESTQKNVDGFSKLTRLERLQRLLDMGAIEKEDFDYLKIGAPLSYDLAEHFIENVLGYFQLPMGVAANFIIDGRELAIPMAVEETSIIAAASKTAKWLKENGEVRTELLGQNIIGQIQIARVKNIEILKKYLSKHKNELIDLANTHVAHGLKARGGGVNDIQLREIDRGQNEIMAVIHVHADAKDAMGANIMNQVCEYLKAPIEKNTSETVTMCILSNLVDTRLTKAKVIMRNQSQEFMKKIEEASLFAELDPYRAATNNKGVLNGIDPILIATGNDWRAVEAGLHAYAARSGQYRSISKWCVVGDELHGELTAPIIVGVVGGVTRLHPMAKISLKMLGVKTAEDLSRICAAVGLVQNLGALRALTTVGIIEGHMKLHIRNLSLGAGATDYEMPYLQRRLEEILQLTKRISLSHAVDILKELRNDKTSRPGLDS